MPPLPIYLTRDDEAWMREHTGPGKPVSRADVLRWGIAEAKHRIQQDEIDYGSQKQEANRND